MSIVSLISCEKYDVSLLEEVIRAHFKNLGGGEKYIKEGAKVLIKPNLLMMKSPEAHTTTHPVFVEAIINVVKSFGGVPVIADSPGGPYGGVYLNQVYRATGMKDAAVKTGAKLNTDSTFSPKSNKEAVKCRAFNIITPVLECDILISVCKLKTHALCRYTGAVKNLFGVIPGMEKASMHLRYPDNEDFNHMLLDLCETVKPQLNFIDGIMAMEGNGPSGGTPRFAGVTLASDNPYEIDLAAAAIIGYEPDEVPTIKLAAKRDLCTDKIDKLCIKGESLYNFIISDFKKPDTHTEKNGMFTKVLGLLKKPIQRFYTLKPKINKEKCIGCGDCAKSCPANTIKIINKKAEINYKECIKCYCCQELCPVKAITFK